MTNNSQGSFVRCTISHNGASFGGGVYLNSSDPELNTSVIAFADSGGGVMLSNGAHPLIRYCDVYGNLGGDFTGDPPETVHILSCDPQFAGPSCVNYHLSTGSCCINTGDPMLPRDPDGTMADIGAFYHDLPCDTSIRATQVTVKYNESDSTIGVYFYAPIAGQYSVWSTFDKNANYPTNFALDTTLVVPEGWNFWKDRSPLVQYKCYIVVHDCP